MQRSRNMRGLESVVEKGAPPRWLRKALPSVVEESAPLGG
jgi:hypothetical protein